MVLPSFRTSAGWRTVKPFDGKTLTGWRPRDPKAKNGWAVVDGELVVVDPKGNSDLVSEVTFQDMQLHLEFNIEPKLNSGVYLRGRYEIQIDNPDAKMALDTHGCGAVYSRLAPTIDATKPAGEWQTLDIEFIGREIEVKLNGKTTVKGVVDGITGGALSPWSGARAADAPGRPREGPLPQHRGQGSVGSGGVGCANGVQGVRGVRGPGADEPRRIHRVPAGSKTTQ